MIVFLMTSYRKIYILLCLKLLIMKISIDTKEDSHEDIRKVIRMLKHLVGEDSYSNQGNMFNEGSGLESDSESSNSESSNDTGTSAFGAMFGDDSPTPSYEGESNSEGEKEEKSRLGEEVEITPY